MLREELFVWMETKVTPQPGKYLIAVTSSLWLAGQANMAKRGATFMSKRHCYTVSICLFCSEASKGPVRAVPRLAQEQTGAWLGAAPKPGLGFAAETGEACNQCKLPGIGCRAHLIKDCTDSLSARNSKYWSKTLFRDIADILKPAHVVLGSALRDGLQKLNIFLLKTLQVTC